MTEARIQNRAPATSQVGRATVVRPAGRLQPGQSVDFRVLEALPRDHYRIGIRRQSLTVESRIPLEVGGQYRAEVVNVSGGSIQLLFKSWIPSSLEALLGQRRLYQAPLAGLLRDLLPLAASLPALRGDVSGAEALRQALLSCGIFYEARLREFVRTGRPAPFLQDLKGSLLELLRTGAAGGAREAVETLLRNLELHQLLGAQAGPNGPVFFWLPFAEDRFVEGFLKREGRRKAPCYRVTLRIPFLEGEELIVLVAWRRDRTDVDLACGPLAFDLLASHAPVLEERLQGQGGHGVRVGVTRGLPPLLAETLKDVRFCDSYG